MRTYRHTQVGTLVVVALGAGILFVVALMAVGDGAALDGVAIGVLALLLFFLFLFGSLTVEVTDTRVAVWFGPGLVRRAFAIESIREARIVRNPWYYGWGMRLTPHGWLFNVSGLDAVQLEFVDGGRFTIGTDEPRRLASAIEMSLSLRDRA